MICPTCGGDPNLHHHVFPSEMIICPDWEGSLYALYRKELRTNELAAVIAKWKYLSPDIEYDFNEEVIKRIVKSSLLKFTEDFIIPANKGDKEKKHYVTLFYPLIPSLLDCAANGNWIGDPEKKYAKHHNTLVFLAMKRDGVIKIDEKGYASLRKSEDIDHAGQNCS